MRNIHKTPLFRTACLPRAFGTRVFVMSNARKKYGDKSRKTGNLPDSPVKQDSAANAANLPPGENRFPWGFFQFQSPCFQAVLVGIGSFILLIAATVPLPACWDEGDALHRIRLIQHWFVLASGKDVTNVLPAGHNLPTSRPFSKKTIDAYWLHTTQLEGHPAGYTLLSVAGKGLSRFLPLGTVPEIVRYRLGHIALFSFALAACFYRMRVTFGFASGLFSVIWILCLPRVFAHSQLIVCDSMLMSGWLLTWAFFEPGLTGRRGAMLWGLMLGLGFSAKFAGWVIPAPYVGFVILCLLLKVKIPGMIRLLLWGIPTGVVVFCLLNPNVWYNPVAGLVRFFSLFLTEKTEHFSVSTLFLNNRYSLTDPLPWYNTLVWMGITVPVGILFLFFWTLGKESFFGFQWLRKRNAEDNQEEGVARVAPSGMTPHRRIALLVLCFSALMVIRSLPGSPVHDGVRQIVSCFPFLGILAGIAAATFWTGNTTPLAQTKKKTVRISNKTVFARVFLLSVIASSAFNLYWYAPNWLSYYNLAIGGLKGATAAGMETTFYWDGMTHEVFDWLNQHTDYEGSVSGVPEYITFVNGSDDLTFSYRSWGLIGPCRVSLEEYVPEGQARWSVFQMRQGMSLAQDYPGFHGMQPAYQRFIRKGGFGPWDLGKTPLIEIYDTQIAQSRAAVNPHSPSKKGSATGLQRNLKKP